MALADGYATHAIEFHVADDTPTITWLAAAPAAASRRYSFSGSGLPWANEEQAFSQAQGGVVAVDAATRKARIEFEWPGAYYADMQGNLVEPTLFIHYTLVSGEERHTRVHLGQRLPWRSLTYPAQRQDAMFYADGWVMPVRTQEQVLRDGGYPAADGQFRMPANHWGLKPPA